MMKWMLTLVIAVLPFTAAAEQGVEGAPLSSRLQPDVLDLLRQEMRALEEAVNQVPAHLARGEWQQVEAIGERIHDSFILKQEMTDAQRKHLQQTLPEAFRNRDRDFHRQARALSQAAARQDADASVESLGRMLRGCVGCHRQYAPQRFPGLNTR